MSSIEKVLGPDGRPRAYRARWRDPDGHQRRQTFRRKALAEHHLIAVEGDMLRGAYVDPTDRTTVREFAEAWRGRQIHRPTTAAWTDTMLTRHVYPALGGRPMAAVRPSEIEAWVKGLSRVLAPSTVGIVHGVVAGMFKAAVRDRLVASNPLEGTRLPRAERADVVPLTVDQVQTLAEKIPARFRALVVLSATTGLRQGECLGLTLDRLDQLRGTVRVDRQMCRAKGVGMYLGPPKTPRSTGTVPLAPVTVIELAQHLAAFPTRVQSIRLADANGQPSETFEDVRLLFTGGRGAPIRRSGFGPDVWAPAVKAAGLPEKTGFHQLRHFYASALIAAPGMSPKTVQARMRHATAAETFDTYGHLWPDNEDRTREAISAAFGSVGCARSVPAGGA